MTDVKVSAGPTFIVRNPIRPETRSLIQTVEANFGKSWIEPHVDFKDGRVNLACYLRGNTPLAQLFSKPVKGDWSSGEIFHLSGRISDYANRHFWIGGFYSRIHKDPGVAGWMQIASPLEAGLMSGIGFSSMCYLLRGMMEQKIVTPYTIVALEASGGRLKDENAEKGMIGLVHYYTSIGFAYVRPQSLFYEMLGHTTERPDLPGPVEDFIRLQFQEEMALAVLMVATVGRILAKCRQSKQVILLATPQTGGTAHRRRGGVKLKKQTLAVRPRAKNRLSKIA